jgi:hypothetical protein
MGERQAVGEKRAGTSVDAWTSRPLRRSLNEVGIKGRRSRQGSTRSQRLSPPQRFQAAKFCRAVARASDAVPRILTAMGAPDSGAVYPFRNGRSGRQPFAHPRHGHSRPDAAPVKLGGNSEACATGRLVLLSHKKSI